MTEPPKYVHPVHFYCIQSHCHVPAVWKLSYSSGAFYTVCEMHMDILTHTLPIVQQRMIALLDGEDVPEDFDPVRITVAVPGHPGFTQKIVVGATPKRKVEHEF